MSTRTNYFTSRSQTTSGRQQYDITHNTSPLCAIPLTPASISSDPSTSTMIAQYNPSSSSTTTTTTNHQQLPTPRQRQRPRPRAHSRQLSITVPPPSRTLQSLLIPTQSQSSQCLRSPFHLRGITHTPISGLESTEKYHISIYADPEEMPTTASTRYGRRRPPAIVFAVLASLLFIFVTFILLAPDAIRQALKDHIVTAINHLCFDKPRGIVNKTSEARVWEPPSAEEVQQLLEW